jgi:hypothetical protein
MNTLQRLCGSQDRHRFLLRELRRLPNVMSMVHHHDDRKTRNIVVTFGSSPYRLIIGAHYDAVPDSPGANDNGAAVVELLALALRLHRSHHERDLTIVFFDKEENPWLGEPRREMGSFCFAHHLNAAGVRPELVLILDVCGAGDTLFFSARDGGPLHPRLVEVFGSKVRTTPSSDNVIFDEAGIPATLLCTLPAEEFSSRSPQTWSADLLHTHRDVPATVSEDTMKQVAALLGELARRF